MIGILDSGVGGLSIYREIKKRFPGVTAVYLADKKNFPYGEKSDEELIAIVREAVKSLIEMGAQVVVLACNSATVSTISALRSEFVVPFVGVEPAVKQAAVNTRNNRIGILATERTTEDHESEKLAPNCTLYKSHNAALIASIEGDYNSITDADLVLAMEPLVLEGVDSIMLGCTHYHFLKNRLVKLYPKIHFYAPEEAVVNRLEVIVKEKNIELTVGNDIFLCSADSVGFGESLYNLLGIRNADIRKV